MVQKRSPVAQKWEEQRRAERPPRRKPRGRCLCGAMLMGRFVRRFDAGGGLHTETACDARQLF